MTAICRHYTVYILFQATYVHQGMEFPTVSKDCKTSVVSQPDFLYGPQVITVIMRKPGKKVIKIDLL